MASRTCWWISSPSETRSGSCAAAGFLVRLSMARSSGGRPARRPVCGVHLSGRLRHFSFPHQAGPHPTRLGHELLSVHVPELAQSTHERVDVWSLGLRPGDAGGLSKAENPDPVDL